MVLGRPILFLRSHQDHGPWAPVGALWVFTGPADGFRRTRKGEAESDVVASLASRLAALALGALESSPVGGGLLCAVPLGEEVPLAGSPWGFDDFQVVLGKFDKQKIPLVCAWPFSPAQSSQVLPYQVLVPGTNINPVFL